MRILAPFPGGGLRLDKPISIEVGHAGQNVFERAAAILGCDIAAAAARGSLGMHPSIAQPAVSVFWLAKLADARQELFELAGVVGHSAGEWTAAVAAGALELEDALKLLVLRGRLIEECVGTSTGTMALVKGPSVQQVKATLTATDDIWIAGENGPTTTVVSLLNSAVRQLEDKTSDLQATVAHLGIPFPSHCPLMRPIALQLREALREVDVRKPALPVANWGSDPDATRIRDSLADNICSPIRWPALLSCLQHELPDTPFCDIWPGHGMRSLLRHAGLRLKRVTEFRGQKPLSDADTSLR